MALPQTTRVRVFTYLFEHPGVKAKEISRALDLTSTAVGWHLNFLKEVSKGRIHHDGDGLWSILKQGHEFVEPCFHEIFPSYRVTKAHRDKSLDKKDLDIQKLLSILTFDELVLLVSKHLDRLGIYEITIKRR